MGAREIGKKWLGRQMVPDYLGREGEESRASRVALAAAVHGGHRGAVEFDAGGQVFDGEVHCSFSE